MRTAPCQDLSGQAFLGSDPNQSSFERQLATSGLCKSFSDARRVNRFDKGLNKRLPYVALVLAARAHRDPSFLSDDLASCKSKAEYPSPAANYALLISRLARAAESRAAEEKKVTTSLEGQRLLLWSQRRGSTIGVTAVPEGNCSARHTEDRARCCSGGRCDSSCCMEGIAEGEGIVERAP